MLPDPFERAVARVAEALEQQGAVLATVESCTGGLLGAALTCRAGSSRYYAGGVIAYDNALKEGLLSIPRNLLLTHGAVSAPVALAMANGGLAIMPQAHFVLAVTGIAGPGGATPEKPLGLVYLAAASRAGQTLVREYRFEGNREAVRFAAGQAAFEMLYEDVLRKTSGVSVATGQVANVKSISNV